MSTEQPLLPLASVIARSAPPWERGSPMVSLHAATGESVSLGPSSNGTRLADAAAVDIFLFPTRRRDRDRGTTRSDIDGACATSRHPHRHTPPSNGSGPGGSALQGHDGAAPSIMRQPHARAGLIGDGEESNSGDAYAVLRWLRRDAERQKLKASVGSAGLERGKYQPRPCWSVELRNPNGVSSSKRERERTWRFT